MGRGHAWTRLVHGLCGVDHSSGGAPEPEEEVGSFLLALALRFLLLLLFLTPDLFGEVIGGGGGADDGACGCGGNADDVPVTRAEAASIFAVCCYLASSWSR
jgi:hypothetical protein